MSSHVSGADQLHRFLFEQAQVRGELVQLQQSYQDLLGQHDYPAPVQRLLGELMVTTSLLTATLKFQGSITVQLQGDGPVHLAVINGDHQQQLRGVARFKCDPSEIPDGSLHDLIGKGHLVLTIAPEQGERYQGVVGLEGDSLAECIEHYFDRSEQLATRIWLKTGMADGQLTAAGMLLQVLPGEGEKHQEDFTHLTTLSDTLRDEELLGLPAHEVLHRLFHQENVQVFEPQSVAFHCGCSKARTERALASLDKQELVSLFEQQDIIDVNCEYCGARYQFDRIDVERLFSPIADSENPTTH